VQVGDKIIIVAYATYAEAELETYKPKVVMVDDENRLTQVLEEI